MKMANITPRRDKNGNITSYTIRVYHGYDSNGKRLKPFTTSYKPEKGMTARQVEKALTVLSFNLRKNARKGITSIIGRHSRSMPNMLFS